MSVNIQGDLTGKKKKKKKKKKKYTHTHTHSLYSQTTDDDLWKVQKRSEQFR